MDYIKNIMNINNMKYIKYVLVSCFLFFTPFFSGLYFEKHFIPATLVLSLILLLQLLEKKYVLKGEMQSSDVKSLDKDLSKDLLKDLYKNKFFDRFKKNINKFFCVIVFLSFFTYVANYFVFDVPFDFEKIFYGIAQILEMILMYYVVVDLCEDSNASNVSIMWKFINGAVVGSTCLIGCLSFFDQWYRKGRFEGTFEYANSMAIFFFISLAFVWKSSIKKIYKVLISSFFVIVIILTNSRMTYLVMAMFVGIIFAYLIINCLVKKFRESKAEKRDGSGRDWMALSKLIVVICTSLILVGIAAFLYLSRYSDFSKRLNVDAIKEDFNLRFSYYEEATNLIYKNPFGYGYEGYRDAQEYKYNNFGCRYKLRVVHNFILQFGLNYGIFMLLVMMSLFGYYIYICKKLNRLLTLENLIIFMVFVHSLMDIGISFLAIDNLLIILAVKNIYCESFLKKGN